MEIFPATKKNKFMSFCKIMDTTGDNHSKGIKPAPGRQILCFLFYVVLGFHTDTLNHMCIHDMKIKACMSKGPKGTDGKEMGKMGEHIKNMSNVK